jgi:hypothetical protein
MRLLIAGAETRVISGLSAGDGRWMERQPARYGIPWRMARNAVSAPVMGLPQERSVRLAN